METVPDTVIEVARIMEMIPHRYPFLLVDRIVNLVPGATATGLKNVTFNEPYFAGHFPGVPVMPGVLIIESMAQTSALLVVATLGPDAEGKLVYFMSIDGARFRKPVVPGDSMLVTVKRLQNRRNVWKFSCCAKVEDNLVAEATIAAMIMDKS
ncbi:MAG: 3-hydroxyacyl-ACP dehydratase FabZ [Alphaproteobacteria bacterium]|jgi:3-hydroxyacyl-[acyl-carrier-protein] dehydratase|nr:3-hydroxyacyl-ACP dehydratase FabZ [Alphaproteobacteria bacterium]MDP6238320.1 3-hydroxyacyl-ACP dehydratase FabZ [Alphaproteobacteria bacterium]MDP7173148.1 3-hydroxyacyl-ACP dehydratase FabZ [Alphaproteobacteria bacterium]MDP7233539.1 3-hydroxyacyl-ACP dehydratase FabZ [Alphaproteobacteria bacterium]MDP7486497.1 3-hydroxyacyl-ACP dehydratase FabZ [Alphaproteobacteria bacterium]|tara:strand:+ start:954 stop:1412 length:459 start_codon:yes stop_codon:yes gene_type:complete